MPSSGAPGAASPTLRLAGAAIPIVGRARMYVCGITPYDTTHLGHAATFVWSDVAARVLRLFDVEVIVCRNITDVDTVLLRHAEEQHKSWRSLATQQTYRFEADMAALAVTRPTWEPNARNYIEDVVALGQALLTSNAAYERDGNLWFRGDEVLASAGIEHDRAMQAIAEHGDIAPGRSPDSVADALVWQASTEQEPSWPSPWGAGRPGWHAECAAMALTLLGPGIDLHTGGEDLAFPHHAYEAAMAEAAIGVRPFARSWMHVGSVHYRGSKMAKSTGNLVLVDDLLERWPAEVVRLLLLSRRYDDSWEFEENALEKASERLEQLWRAAGRPATSEGAREAMLEALLDDLDVPGALAIAQEAGGPGARELAKLLGLL